MNNTELFEKTPIPQAVMKLMIPTIVGSLVVVLYSLVDTYFVGMLGNEVQNAAVTLAAPVLLAFNAVNNLFGVGSSSMMSRALGRKDYSTVKKSASFGLYSSIFFGVLMSLGCLVFFTPLLHLLGANEITMEATAAYMKWTVLLGATPSILNVVFSYMVRSEGYAAHASVGVMSGCVLNMILDPLFILPFGLNMGAAGAGLATLISNCVACIYFIILLYKKKDSTNITLHPKYFSLDTNIMKGIFAVGIPAAIQNLLNVTGMTILNNFTASYGAQAVAAMGISYKIYMVPLQVALGGSQGIMPLVSYNYASGNYKRMKHCIGFVAKIMVPTMACVAALFWVFSSSLIQVFMNNADVIYYGTMFLKAQSIAMPFLMTDFLIVGVLQALGLGKKALFFAILRKVICEIPAIFILNALFGVNGLAYSAFFAEVIVCICGIITLIRIIRQLERGQEIV